MYERGVTGVLSKNMLLYFAYADFEEGRMKYEKVHSVYQKLVEMEDTDPTLVRVHLSSANSISSSCIPFSLFLRRHHIFCRELLLLCSEFLCICIKTIDLLQCDDYGVHNFLLQWNTFLLQFS